MSDLKPSEVATPKEEIEKFFSEQRKKRLAMIVDLREIKKWLIKGALHEAETHLNLW